MLLISQILIGIFLVFFNVLNYIMLHTKILLRQKNSTSKLKTSLNITESQHGLSKPKFLKDLSNDTCLSLWVKHGKNIHPLKLYRGVTFFFTLLCNVIRMGEIYTFSFEKLQLSNTNRFRLKDRPKIAKLRGFLCNLLIVNNSIN